MLHCSPSHQQPNEYISAVLWKRLQIRQAKKTDNSDKASEKTDTLWTGRARSLKSKITIFRLFSVQATIDNNYREIFDQRLVYVFPWGKKPNKRDT